MTCQTKLTSLLTMLAIISCIAISDVRADDVGNTTVIKVGVITYSDYDKTYTEKQRDFGCLAAQYNSSRNGKGSNISFQLAVGAYDDVLEWYKNGFIDVAILSPGTVAALLSTDGWEERINDLYIGTSVLAHAAAENSFAVPERRLGTDQVQYHSVCVVKSDSKIKDWPDLERNIKEHNVEFLFIHPLSASGRILPEYVLRKLKGITPTELTKNLVEATWTYDYASTIKALQQPARNGREKVAFVSDSVGDDARVRATVRKISIPELDQFWIPREVALISSNFSRNKQLVKDIFVPSDKSGSASARCELQQYVEVPDWIQQYHDGMSKWVRELELEPRAMGQRFLAMSQIIDKVRSHENNHPGTSRLALVLSGGGAKCAYQIGVIKAIENQLRFSNEQSAQTETAPENDRNSLAGKLDHASDLSRPRPEPLNIGLVVGTSGGAINALTVALGLTSTPEGQEDLETVWLSFKQQDFFLPWSPMPFTLGLIVGLVQTLIIVLGLRLFDDRRIEWKQSTRLIVILLSMVLVALSMTSWRFWASLPLIAIFVIVGVQLFESQSENWRVLTGLCLLVLGGIELLVSELQVAPWAYVPYVIPAIGIVVASFVIILSTRVLTLDGPGWARIVSILVPLVIATEVFILLIWKGPILWMDKLARNHVMHHLWMALTINLTLSALSLMVFGLLMLAAEWYLRAGRRHARATQTDSVFLTGSPAKPNFAIRELKRGINSLAAYNARFFASRRPLLIALLITLASLFTLQIGRTLFLDTSLSRAEGIDRAFAEKLPILLQHHPDVGSVFRPLGSDDRQRLADISRKIVSNGWLKRDLVITSSLLTAGDQQPDMYFYYQHPGGSSSDRLAPDKTFPPDRRFRSFQEPGLTDRLLDIVIGSSTIYPVFDPRRLTVSLSPDGGDIGSGLDLIDGGFAHNSPIEAAVAWGATHIILIEASPKAKPSLHRNLLDNSLDAFNYLFNEAQMVDAHSRGKIEIFSIRPDADDSTEDPNLCTFDFDDVLMKGAIDKGGTDASNLENPRFLRERGQPIF